MKSTGAWIFLSMGALLLLYIVGVVVRGQFGIRIALSNNSGEVLRNVGLKEETHGPRHELGNVSVGVRRRVFIQPKTESHIVLEFQDAAGRRNSETIVGYVEGGYCGSANVTVEPDGKIIAQEPIDILFCKGSWLDFAR